MAVWMQHKPKREKPATTRQDRKTSYVATRELLIKMVNGYRTILKGFEPMSDDWAACMEYVLRYERDLEILESGTHEERKGVIEKYGR